MQMVGGARSTNQYVMFGILVDLVLDSVMLDNVPLDCVPLHCGLQELGPDHCMAHSRPTQAVQNVTGLSERPHRQYQFEVLPLMHWYCHFHPYKMRLPESLILLRLLDRRMTYRFGYMFGTPAWSRHISRGVFGK